ncbi:fibronectin type III domain-containing protein [Streptomyces sp. NPDC048521]|uniref:fibronectin type III domain-containing protein n=1 Tax=Streptomyces sp. NPDC048521 TaxID=3365566 RepID=UPI003717AE4F
MPLRKSTTRVGITACAAALLAAASLTTAFGSETRDAKTLSAAPLTTWQTNGIVWSIASAHGVVYVGGSFDSVRPPGARPGEREVARKNFAAFDAVTGKLLPCSHSFTRGPDDSVRALDVSPDGKVLYVGGSFGQVDGKGVANAAAIDTGGCSLRKDFRPVVEATVRAIDATDEAVYLGGDFQAVGGRSRRHLASFSPRGALLPFRADIDRPVLAVLAVPDRGKVIVGGDFQQVNGSAESALVGLDPWTGATVASYPDWIPRDVVGVKTLARDGDTFYLGAEGQGTGVFDGRIAGRLSDGKMLWKDSCQGATQAVVPYQGVLYSASHAHNCDSTPGGFLDGRRQHFLANSARDGHLLHWFPDTDDGIGESNGPRTLAMVGKILWAGGEFTTVNGKPQQSLTRFAAGPENAAPEGTPRLAAATTRAGKVALTWRATWDRDNAELTYRIYRDGTLVASPKQRSTWWNRPDMTYTDSVTPGSRHRYTIAVTDGRNTSPASKPVDVTAAAKTRR